MNPSHQVAPCGLRAEAEALLADIPDRGSVSRTAEQLVHELQVHQIELEMQNENLRNSLHALEEARARFVDFYDFAPIGYITLTDEGLIADINLPGAAMLGMERENLRHARFARFVAAEDAERWHLHLTEVLKHQAKRDCELGLRRADGFPFHARLDSVRLDKAGRTPSVRIALSDISRLKRADFELRQAQRLARVGSWFWDAKTGESMASEEMCRLFGREVIPPFAEQSGTLYSAEVWQQLNAARQRALRNGISCDLEVPALHGDGSPLWIQMRFDPLLIASGDVVGLRGTVQDITERKQREDLLRMQALVLDQIQDHVSITDLSGVVSYVNQSKARALGKPAAALRGQHVSAFGDAPEADATQQQIIEATLTQGSWDGLIGNFVADGSCILLDLRTTLVKDDYGKPVAVVGVANDITERRRVEEALRRREQYQRAVLDNFPFMVWLKDEQSRFLAVNAAFASGFGWPSAEALIGKTDFDIAAPDLAEAYRAEDRAVLASGRSRQVRELIEIGGRRLWFETYKSPITIDGHVSGVVGFARDISDWKRAEAELIAARATAEKANNAKSRFLASASHDLRQPLAALALFVDVLKRNAAPDCSELLTNIQHCVDSLSELLTDLLDVSKLDAGVVTPNPADFAVAELLAAVASIHSADAAMKGLRLRVRCSGGDARSDPQLMQRILGNLVANAINYTRAGGVLIACRRRHGKRWIEVWDTGIGIPAEKLDFIFEEFRQLAPSSQGRGSGLGLAIVARLAALLGLEIRVRSRPGRGSMFAVELPAGCLLEAEPADSVQANPGSLRIGLVEDNAMLLQALVLALEASGHEVVTATSGRALLSGLGDRGPDIVISDYRLAAGETGFEVIAAARQAFGESLPAMIITGDTDPTLIRSMAARGIVVHYKPIQVAALQDAIRQATDPRES